MKFEITKSFIKSVEKLNDQKINNQLKQIFLETSNAKKLDELKNIKKLKGYKNYFRIRSGTYRIGLQYVNETIIFIIFEHRKDIYNKFP